MDPNLQKNADASAAPRVVEIACTTYLVRPFADEEYGAVANWVNDKLEDPVQAMAKKLEGLPPHVQQAAIAKAVELSVGGGASATPSMIRKHLMTKEGAAFVTWLAVRRDQPHVTLAQLAEAITDDNKAEVLDSVGRAVGLSALGNATGR